MAQYRATIQGNRGEASRLGTKASGITATINGWGIGVVVYLNHVDGHDVLTIFHTGGSNYHHHSNEPIATIEEAPKCS